MRTRGAAEYPGLHTGRRVADARHAALFEVLEEDVPLSRRERETLNASVDQALMEACAGYVLVLATYNEQLLAILAHDMRTPLGVAHTNATLIQRDPVSAEVPR